MSEASITSAHGYITVSGVVLVVGLLLIRAAIRKPEKWRKALLLGTLFVLAAGVYNFVILIGVMF